MSKKFTLFGFTDIHNQQSMLDLPTTLRKSAVIAAEDAVAEFGQADLSVIGGDNISDYPNWNKSAWLPNANFLDIKDKLVQNFAPTAKGERVFYVAGNNDMILGDISHTEDKPYNTTEFYFTGPMKDTLGELSESDCLTCMSKEKPWEQPYLLAFHYMVEGVDFLGINIHPDTAYDSHEGYYTDETLLWVKAKLNELDPDGYKPVFVVGHLSAQCYIGGTQWKESMINGNVNLFYDAFRGHRNLFYLYGHIHGEQYVYREHSSGAVLHIGSDLRCFDANLHRESNEALPDYEFSLVHMGGLRPFNLENFEDDGLTGYGGLEEAQYYPATGTPKLAQYLVMELYDDRAVFHIRNTGSLPGYTRDDKPEPYTVYLQKP